MIRYFLNTFKLPDFHRELHFKPNTYKNAKSQSIGAEPGLEPESEAAYPGALPHYPYYAILHHFHTHTHVFTVKIRIIIKINTINQQLTLILQHNQCENI